MATHLRFNLGDERLNRRGSDCIERLVDRPSDSFPKVFRETADLEGFYRLLHNSRVTPERLVSTIRDQSFASAGGEGEAIVIHDTTIIKPVSKHPREFESLSGFWSHVSLLASPVDSHRVFGPIGLKMMTRGSNQQGRWIEQVDEAESHKSDGLSLIHVMDSEADSCQLWSEMLERKLRFVIRVCHNRKARTGRNKLSLLFDEIERADVIGTREVMVSKRSASPIPRSKERHATRDSRTVTLRLSAKKIEVYLTHPVGNSQQCHYYNKTITVNVVRAFEHSRATTGSHAVDWILLTSEPIETLAQVEKVIDVYRRRWQIEEFFRALKTGCRIEGRLVADAQAWFNLVALMLPVAHAVLSLRMLLHQPIRRAKEIFSETQLKIIKIKAREFKYSVETISDLQRVIAKLGGHIKWNGDPGWITLLRGMIELRQLEAGWIMAEQSSDK